MNSLPMKNCLLHLGLLLGAMVPAAHAGLFNLASANVSALGANSLVSQGLFDAAATAAAAQSAQSLHAAGGVTNVLGSVTSSATARAAAGQLGIGTSVNISSAGAIEPLKGSAGTFENAAAGQFFDAYGAQAEFTSSDLVISPVPGSGLSGAGTLTAQLNLSLDGSFLGNATGPFAGTASVVSRLNLVVRFGYMDPVTFSQGGTLQTGQVTLTQSSGGVATFDGGSGLFAGYTGGPLALTTVAAALPIGVPIELSVRLANLTTVQATGTIDYQGGVDYLHTLSLPTSGPVLNLPSGYTAASTELNVANNAFTAVPEPEEWALFAGTALLAGGLWQRRQRLIASM